jgi:hypothetical protein
MFRASVAFGPMAEVTHCRKTTATGVPSVIFDGLEKTGPKPFAAFTAHANRTIPKIGMMHVFTIKRYRSLDTLSHSSGACRMMARKKQRSSAEVIGPEDGRWLGKWLKDGQMALSMVDTHWPAWYVCVPNQIIATIPLTACPLLEAVAVWV